MAESFQDIEIDDALAASLRVLGAVKNADGYDELASEISHRYALRSEYLRAVEIADTINDPYTMEKSIAEIAVMLSAEGKEADAFELIDSIEDFSHQATAKSQVAVAHAAAGDFDRAMEIASGMDDNSATLVDIAYQFADKGLHDRALAIPELLDFPLGEAWIRMRVAQDYYKAGRTEEAIELFSHALDDTEAIDPPNERVAALSELALRFNEAGRAKEAADVMEQAIAVATEADMEFRDAAFSHIATGHARLTQYDEAVSIVEKVESIYLATSTLVDLSVIEHQDDERHSESAHLLSDAYDLISAEEPQSQRDESQQHYLLSRIATSFAYFGEPEKALQASASISALDTQYRSLAEVAMRFAESGEFEHALTSQRSIGDDGERAAVLIRIGHAMIAADAHEQGIEVLTEASRLIDDLDRPLEKVQNTASLAIAYAGAGERELLASLINKTLQYTRSISSPDARASALISIYDACDGTEFEMDAEAKEKLWDVSVV